jgi:hypothetical protein
MGVGLGAIAKGFRIVFEGVFGPLAKTAGKDLVGIVETGMKNPKSASIFKKFAETAGPMMGKLKSGLETAGKFMSEKLGLSWIGEALSGIGDAVAKILEAIGFKSSAVKAAEMGVTQKELTRIGAKKATKAGLGMAGATYAFEKGGEMYRGYKAGKEAAEMSKFATAIPDETIKSNVNTNMDNLLNQMQ